MDCWKTRYVAASGSEASASRVFSISQGRVGSGRVESTAVSASVCGTLDQSQTQQVEDPELSIMDPELSMMEDDPVMTVSSLSLCLPQHIHTCTHNLSFAFSSFHAPFLYIAIISVYCYRPV